MRLQPQPRIVLGCSMGNVFKKDFGIQRRRRGEELAHSGRRAEASLGEAKSQ
jgi:hypothetical protein